MEFSFFRPLARFKNLESIVASDYGHLDCFLGFLEVR
jgi:hypothetical protein